MSYPAGWPSSITAELFVGMRSCSELRFTSLAKAIGQWRGLEVEAQAMTVIMVDPRIPAGKEGERLMRLDHTDILRVAAIMGL